MSDAVLPTVPTAAAGEAASGLEIRLFGPMEVKIGPHPLSRLRSRKGLWLLALLALRAGRDVDRRWLAETLWPDDDAGDARHSLRQSLSDLRLALGPEARRLTSEGSRLLRMELSGAFVDVLAFDAATARDDIASLGTAVGLYRGPLLEDCGEEWVLAERQPREQAYVAALERLAAAATARGEHVAAAGHLQSAVGVEPYREDLQRALMEALAAAGNPVAALLVYRQYRELLWQEMTAEPAEETTALFRRLRDETRARARSRPPEPASAARPGSSAPPAPAPRPLPLPLTALIGREEEVREVRARLARSRLVTLTGTGGVGKTRLALQVAQELAEEYADGSGFVDLAPLADPERVPDTVRVALGVPPGAPDQEPLETLRQSLSRRRLLIVLDNCEHLLDACAALADALLSQCGGIHILATSRQPLGLPGEWVWRVPSLAVPHPGEGSRVDVQWPMGRGSSTGHQPSTLDHRPSTIDHDAVPGRAAVSGTRPRRGSVLRADAAQRRGDRGGVLAAGWHSSGDRVGGGAGEGTAGGADRRAPRRPLPPLDRWKPRRPAAPANAARHDRVE